MNDDTCKPEIMQLGEKVTAKPKLGLVPPRFAWKPHTTPGFEVNGLGQLRTADDGWRMRERDPEPLPVPGVEPETAPRGHWTMIATNGERRSGTYDGATMRDISTAGVDPGMPDLWLRGTDGTVINVPHVNGGYKLPHGMWTLIDMPAETDTLLSFGRPAAPSGPVWPGASEPEDAFKCLFEQGYRDDWRPVEPLPAGSPMPTSSRTLAGANPDANGAYAACRARYAAMTDAQLNADGAISETCYQDFEAWRDEIKERAHNAARS